MVIQEALPGNDVLWHLIAGFGFFSFVFQNYYNIVIQSRTLPAGNE